jgi:hypothetical protein
MITKLSSVNQPTSGTRISIPCPHCGHNGTFEQMGNDTINNTHIFGLRRCPNESCFGYLFFIYNNQFREIIMTYPSVSIPFDKNNIPKNISDAFQEAITTHANNCYVASAIMIRKTLEEICADKGAKGDNLYSRLNELSSKIIIPQELVLGMNELRLLGNDAAHIESKTFNELGKAEIEISLEFTKEILKAVYQYESLLEKLKSLKKNN